MRLIKYLTSAGVMVFLFFIIIPENAYAYLDPGTGSYIFQILLAALVGTSFAIKLYWRRVKAFFSGSKEETETENTDE